MTLAEYLERERLTQAQFARRVGARQQIVAQWIAGVHVPRREAMLRIVAATDGAVLPNDFYLPVEKAGA